MSKPIRFQLAALALVVFPSFASANLLANGGFESGSPQLFFPPGTGVWATDPTVSVGSENGIAPLEGIAMLRFLYTYPDPPVAGNASGADLWQLVDATSFAGSTIRLTASFNRIPGDSETDTEFRMGIRAFSGDPAEFDDNFPVAPPFIADSSANLFSDGDPGTWETISLDWAIPAGTDYLGIFLSAIENIQNDVTGVEFDGHYADDARLEIIASTSVPQASARASSWGEIKQSFR